jgi:putative ABC transport system permease protein
MLRAALKSVLARKLRLALTALAIVLGVSFVAGSLVLTDTALSAFDDIFGEVFAKTDVVVQSKQAFQETPAGGGGGGTQERNPLPASLLGEILALPDVRTADGSVNGFAQVVEAKTAEVVSGGGAPTIGSSWDPNTTPLQIRSGEAPVQPDEVAIDANTVRKARLEVGEKVQIVTQTGSDTYTLSAIVGLEGADTIGGATFALFDLGTAQRLFDREGLFDQIYVVGL